jgi:uncharacterized protein (DUF1810 family)
MMPPPKNSGSQDDLYDLNRFLLAQQKGYEPALLEITSGQKRTHWMWYIFPQIDGLGSSNISKHYAIKSVEEAKAYLDHTVLGPRLVACAEAAFRVEGRTSSEIFGFPDNLKLKSSTTLFASLLPQGSVFDCLLKKYFRGKRDPRTLRLLHVWCS